MARIGIAGYLNNKVKFMDARPTLIWIMDQIENFANGQVDSANLAAGGVATANIADASVTAAKLAASSVTSAATVDGIGLTASGSVTGDGTVSRVVSVGFTPRWVQVIRADATFVEYVSLQQAGNTTSYYRDNTGAQAALVANWQGITTGGFKFGSGPGTSNVLGVSYAWVAWK